MGGAPHGARLLARDPGKENALKRQGVQALFGLQLAFASPRLATLSLIPDFQHMHLPEMFSKAEVDYREHIYRECARHATRVIVFSETVRKDFEQFAPQQAKKARTLPPISFVPETLYEQELAPLLARYHLPEKFVYLPNQFWKHKNHGVAFQAARILKERGVDVKMVCSGFPGDYRHPEYFGEIWQKLSAWNIREQVLYLGQLPHEHVLMLMRQSVCVLNPSRFEGWGITVEEARSVGKQVVISDIAAHREQNPPRATWFDANSAEELAEKLADLWRATPPGPDGELERAARTAQPRRVRAYAEAFAGVAREAVASGEGRGS